MHKLPSQICGNCITETAILTILHGCKSFERCVSLSFTGAFQVMQWSEPGNSNSQRPRPRRPKNHSGSRALDGSSLASQSPQSSYPPALMRKTWTKSKLELLPLSSPPRPCTCLRVCLLISEAPSLLISRSGQARD